MTHHVFAYGTLQLPDVQTSLFDRVVPTIDDSLPGFHLEWLQITDPEVIATSGSDWHPLLRRGEASDVVEGAYLVLDDVELAAADSYEVDDYVRVGVTLSSGVDAWVYLSRDDR